MIAIEKIKGVTAPHGAEIYKPSELQPIAHIPCYLTLINPEYTSDNKFLDQVNGVNLANDSAATSQNIKKIDENTLFSTSIAEGKFFRLYPTVDIDGNAHTVVFIAKADESTKSGSLSAIVASQDSDGLGNAIKVAFSATRNAISYYGNGGLTAGSAVKVQHILTPEQRAKLCLFVVSFSTEKGYTIRIDGKEVATNKNDKEERTSQLKAGEYALLRGYAGQCGIVTMLNTDLTLPENSIFLKEMEDLFMSKYDVKSD